METTADDIDTLFEEITEIKQPKKAHMRTVKGKKIKVRSGVQLARDEYKKARKHHREAIHAERGKIWESYKRVVKMLVKEHQTRSKARKAIKTHAILSKQAKAVYTLTKLEGK